MPNIMIHEKVGEYISKKINRNSYDFFLGILAPDAPNLEGFAPKEERWEAHQRRKDYDEWRKSIDEFYQKEKDSYPRDFILGYYIHILTDIVYDDLFYLDVRDRIEEKYTREESHDVMRNDMEKYYFDGIESIKEILSQSKTSYDILNISKDKLLRWKEKNILLEKPQEKNIYVTNEVIERLSEKVYEELMERIEF